MKTAQLNFNTFSYHYAIQSVKMSTAPVVIRIFGENYSWVPEVQKALDSLNLETNQKLLLYAEKETYNGILGFFNCLLKESNGNNVRYVLARL